MKTVRIRMMTTDDLELGLRLSRQAGWNQTEADWLRLLHFEPEGCFVAELDGSPVGTTTTCVLGHVAWIAMVLVDENHRRRGVGTHLLRHALDNAGAVKIAESSGLKIQRCFTRMYRGKKVTDTIEALWASSSPEKG